MIETITTIIVVLFFILLLPAGIAMNRQERERERRYLEARRKQKAEGKSRLTVVK